MRIRKAKLRVELCAALMGLSLAVLGCADQGEGSDSGGIMVPPQDTMVDPDTGERLPPGTTIDPDTGLPTRSGGDDGAAGSDAPDAEGDEPGTQLGTPIPCGVANVVADNCGRCHGQNPMGGAIRLVSHEDWHRVSPVYGPDTLGDTSKLVHEVAQIRINNGEMPQGEPMSPEDLATLDEWLLAGAGAGTDEDAACAPPVIDPGDDDLRPVGGLPDECGGDDAYEPLVALPGETCYDFQVHGISSPTDTSKFNVAPGESYHELIYDVPWPAGTVATRFGADFDNLQVLHHWLAFDYTTPQPHGTVNVNVTGTTLGAAAQLIGGWAVGGCNFVLPEEMGLKLPNPGGSKIMVQWHMFNSTGVSQPDGTKVQFCTTTPDGRPNIGGLTWLGTENFNGVLGMPAGEHEFSGTCINDSGGPITIVGFLPHLHTIGTNMRSEVMRAGTSTWETVFDQPFQFDYQVHYMMDPFLVLEPNDQIKSTCTFFNDTGVNVAFGQSTNQEMCYQFAFSYPAGALDNGVLSLIGATNTCWQFGE
ncbi:MAG: hypothetical protein OXT09_01825 [Myxococcales bacterium]|nr:hypothetical protein [Myxococcales bacterium]